MNKLDYSQYIQILKKMANDKKLKDTELAKDIRAAKDGMYKIEYLFNINIIQEDKNV
ncbi:MAG: hypothetical protein ACLTYB_17275 [Clostridium paraputrificum]